MSGRRLGILVFAYVYPPDSGSGTFRTLYFTNEWSRQGDNVAIVTVKEECFLEGASVDLALLAKVCNGIEVIRATARRPLQSLLNFKSWLLSFSTGRKPSPALRIDAVQKPARISKGRLTAIKDLVTDILSCPDEHVGWIVDAVAKGLGALRREQFDCIYATGGPWSGLVAATIVCKLSGRPLVLDFRDPWIGNPNLASKSRMSRWIQARMESICVRASSYVITNTEPLRRTFIARYPQLDQSHFVTVTNGFEDPPTASVCDKNERFTIVHAGALYLSRNPHNLLLAVHNLIANGLIPASRIRLCFVGGLELGDQPVENGRLIQETLQTVLEILPRISHEEAMRIQSTASVLLLIQTGFPLQIPRKLFEYVSMSRPVLAIAEHGSATANLVGELGLGPVADNDVDSIQAAILSLYSAWKAGGQFKVDEAKLFAYENRFLSNRIRELMLHL